MAGFRRDGHILQSDPFALAYMKCSEVRIILTLYRSVDLHDW